MLPMQKYDRVAYLELIQPRTICTYRSNKFSLRAIDEKEKKNIIGLRRVRCVEKKKLGTRAGQDCCGRHAGPQLAMGV